VLAVDYFENIQFASWMSGPVLNEDAQKARSELNRVMGDVLISLELLRVPHVVNYQPPPRTGGYVQNLDVILNMFSLWEFQIGPEQVFDSTDRAIGAYERECEKLRRKSFNPFYWLGMLFTWGLGLPFKLLGIAGFDATKAEASIVGKVVKLVWGLALGLAAFIPAILETADHWCMVRTFIQKCVSAFHRS